MAAAALRRLSAGCGTKGDGQRPKSEQRLERELRSFRGNEGLQQWCTTEMGLHREMDYE